jgi:tripeptidyl-peptidase-1
LCVKYGCATGNTSQTVNFVQEQWTTGGGFAIYSESRADWQSSVVDEYLNSNVTLPNATQWNQNGRAYPDVTANGHNCPVYDASYGGLQPIDGTSCSSPVFAALMALANDHQTAKGCPRIGFANPLLYLVAQTTTGVFTQPNVTNNHCTEATCCSNDFGFNAPPTPTTWNPISGLGQLNHGLFLAYLDSIKC